MARPMGTLGNVETIVVGGRNIPYKSNIKFLYGAAIGANYTVLQEGNASTTTGSGYQVPGGKRFRVAGVIVSTLGIATSGANTHTLGYMDSDIGINTATVPTSPKYLAGVPDSPNGISFFTNSTTQNEARVEYGYINFNILAGKYGFFKVTGGGDWNFIVIGYEEAI